MRYYSAMSAPRFSVCKVLVAVLATVWMCSIGAGLIVVVFNTKYL